MRMLVAIALAAQASTPGPPTSSVRLDTTKGAIVIAVHRDWAPRGADRFRELAASGYYDDTRFFRVVKGQWAQFGINGDPKVSARWRTNTIPDDPPKQSNTRGRVAFAFKDPNGRTTQVYISLRDLSYHTPTRVRGPSRRWRVSARSRPSRRAPADRPR